MLRVNQRIRAREVHVIDPEGKSLGVLPIQDALQRARDHGLDLVEISPRATPPVCKILDFGKYRYEMAKREKEARKHNLASKLKELKFRLNIDEHDYLVKLRRAEYFMLKGMKVKLLLAFRGRELQRKDDGMDLVQRIRHDLAHVGTADAEPKLLGRNINVMLTPLPASKRTRKYTQEDEPEVEDAEDHDDDDDHGETESAT